MDSTPKLETVRSYYAFVDARNFSHLFDLFSDDVEYLRFSNRIVGKKNFEIFTETFDLFPVTTSLN
ncbi:MAG: nuclear transport factor 2 family protein [archaeon]